MVIRNDWEFRVFGMTRSGNHAIIVWLASHFPAQSVHFINNVPPFADPFRFHSNTQATTIKSSSFVNRNESEIVQEREMRKNCLIYNYENPNLISFRDRHPVPHKSNVVGDSGREFSVLILRDPFNFTAGQWKKSDGKRNKSWHFATLDMWMSHAREFIGITNFLGPKILINFNQWFSDEKYRRNLANQFGRSFTDSGLQRVTANGAGSSWDGTKFDHRAQKMNVLSRWKGFSMDRNFRRQFHGRDDVRRLSEQIFGAIEGTQDLFELTIAPVRYRINPLRHSVKSDSLT